MFHIEGKKGRERKKEKEKETLRGEVNFSAII